VLQYTDAKKSHILADVEAQYHFDALAALTGSEERDAGKEAAKKEQEAAVLETKVTYVRRLSHEVRTPLQVIYSGLQYIIAKKNNEVTSGVMSVLEEMRQSCIDGIGILDDMVSYERLDAGTMTLEKETVVVSDFVRKSLRDFDISARLSNVSLEYTDPFGESRRSPPVVKADALKLGQVVRNMVSNGLKYTPSGGSIKVKVYCPPTSHEGVHKVRIDFTDTGPGLSSVSSTIALH
jgi:signal transduction histidine kinase